MTSIELVRYRKEQEQFQRHSCGQSQFPRAAAHYISGMPQSTEQWQHKTDEYQSCKHWNTNVFLLPIAVPVMDSYKQTCRYALTLDKRYGAQNNHHTEQIHSCGRNHRRRLYLYRKCPSWTERVCPDRSIASHFSFVEVVSQIWANSGISKAVRSLAKAKIE
jgi:hypothetical protein